MEENGVVGVAKRVDLSSRWGNSDVDWENSGVDWGNSGVDWGNSDVEMGDSGGDGGFGRR